MPSCDLFPVKTIFSEENVWLYDVKDHKWFNNTKALLSVLLTVCVDSKKEVQFISFNLTSTFHIRLRF